MNIKDLRYYIYLADSLSFTKTAEKFQVSQPSISIALKRLEDSFETTLIQRNRSAQNIQMTKSGELLYETAHQILDLLEETQHSISKSKSLTVSLGLLPGMGNIFLPRLMDVVSKYVDKIIFLEESTSETMIDKLDNFQTPIAIIAHSEETIPARWIEQHVIEEQSLAAYVSPNHPLAKEKEIQLKDLAEHNIIGMMNEFVHGQVFAKALTESSLALSLLHQTHDVQTMMTLTESGLYVGVMSDIFAKGSKLKKVPIVNAPTIYLSLIINKEMAITEMQAEFNEDVKKALLKD